MYENFYQLQARPFQLTPDPAYYFESLTHRKALSYLGYGLAQGEGFIVITGEVGAGKTTLVGHLMATIDKARLTAANIVTSSLDAGGVLGMAAHHFGVPVKGADKSVMLSGFESFLHEEARAGRRCLLIVDEAQNLSVEALEELRMLSNFQLGGHALLQIFLLGQPEFRDQFQNAPELEQLRQRVIAHHHLGPMAADEIEPYVAHRLTKAGWSGNPDFSDEVFARIFTETGGVPRLVNQLMSRILLMGAVEEAGLIDLALVERVLVDIAEDNAAAKKSEIRFVEPAPSSEKQTETQQTEPDETAARVEPALEDAMRAITQLRTEAKVARQAAEAAMAAASSKPDEDILTRLDEISRRLTQLEDRSEQADANLHRLLAMLINWVENDIREKDDYVGTGRAA